MSDKDIELIEVFQTTSRSDLAFVESVFISHNIHYFIENESVSRAFYSSALPLKIRVPTDQVQKAREIIQEMVD